MCYCCCEYVDEKVYDGNITNVILELLNVY